MWKTPVGLVTIGLTVAILLAASLLIVTGTHGEDRAPAAHVLPFQGR
jgi:succinylglutamate desuccinylase